MVHHGESSWDFLIASFVSLMGQKVELGLTALLVQLLLVELIYFSLGLFVWTLASKRPGCLLVCLDLPDQGLRKRLIFRALLWIWCA